MKKRVKLRNGKMAEAESADGVKGFLLSDNEHTWFRIYDENHNFKDYALYHHDLEIQITDQHAYFYVTEDGRTYLDYSPEALGYEDEQDTGESDS